ncbi:MAG: hypothetical protein JWR15_4331, partial [Prosthecobacter sp.]|nr:hypothetical protein [Prosthecobacter sp.]
PAVDPLFRTAAVHHGTHVTGVILTGYLNDGTSGAAAIKQCGGTIVVQDPAEAEAPAMPESVLKHVGADHCVTLEEMGPLLLKLMQSRPIEPLNRQDLSNLRLESEIAAMRHQDDTIVDKLGCRTTLTCPECQGVLWEITDEHLLRYRCHTGHAYTAEWLAGDQAAGLERSLYGALKSLSECKTLALRLASQAEKEGDATTHRQLKEKAAQLSEATEQIRVLLANDGMT